MFNFSIRPGQLNELQDTLHKLDSLVENLHRHVRVARRAVGWAQPACAELANMKPGRYQAWELHGDWTALSVDELAGLVVLIRAIGRELDSPEDAKPSKDTEPAEPEALEDTDSETEAVFDPEAAEPEEAAEPDPEEESDTTAVVQDLSVYQAAAQLQTAPAHAEPILLAEYVLGTGRNRRVLIAKITTDREWGVKDLRNYVAEAGMDFELWEG